MTEIPMTTVSESGLHGSPPLSKTVRVKDTNVSETRLGREISVTQNSDNSSLLSQSYIKKCLTCGKPFKPKNRNQTHCSEHLVKTTRKVFNCLWCGNPLYQKVKFCSDECTVMFKIFGKSKAEMEKEKLK